MIEYGFKFLGAFGFLFLSYAAAADLPAQEKIWSTRDSRWLTLSEWRAEVSIGDVLVLGEQHAVGESLSEKVHHSNQLRLIQELSSVQRISLGMEFFEYPKQNLVDQYLAGSKPENEFLSEVGWGGNSWPLYREQVLEAGRSGHVYALNIPRSVSRNVGRGGPDSLTSVEKALLPPLWELGSAPYFERFSEIMNGHVSGQQLTNYFWAQSLWDDTMAWKTAEHHRADEVLVIIAGEFHVEYGHALPARLVKHGLSSVKTMLQVELSEWSESNLSEAIAAHPKYGPRADYLWVYQLPIEAPGTGR